MRGWNLVNKDKYVGMTQQGVENKQIKGITYKLLFGFISVIISIIFSVIIITASITEYKEGVRYEIRNLLEKSITNKDKISANTIRINELESMSKKHDTEIEVLKNK